MHKHDMIPMTTAVPTPAAVVQKGGDDGGVLVGGVADGTNVGGEVVLLLRSATSLQRAVVPYCLVDTEVKHEA